MSRKNDGVSIVALLIIVGLILFCAFQNSFLSGLKTLGEIVNILGAVFVWLIKLIFSIPQLAEEILKRIITTLLVLILSAWWCVDDVKEQQIVKVISKVIVAILFAVLSWIGMF